MLLWCILALLRRNKRALVIRGSGIDTVSWVYWFSESIRSTCCQWSMPVLIDYVNDNPKSIHVCPWQLVLVSKWIRFVWSWLYHVQIRHQFNQWAQVSSYSFFFLKDLTKKASALTETKSLILKKIIIIIWTLFPKSKHLKKTLLKH